MPRQRPQSASRPVSPECPLVSPRRSSTLPPPVSPTSTPLRPTCSPQLGGKIDPEMSVSTRQVPSALEDTEACQPWSAPLPPQTPPPHALAAAIPVPAEDPPALPLREREPIEAALGETGSSPSVPQVEEARQLVRHSLVQAAKLRREVPEALEKLRSKLERGVSEAVEKGGFGVLLAEALDGRPVQGLSRTGSCAALDASAAGGAELPCEPRGNARMKAQVDEDRPEVVPVRAAPVECERIRCKAKAALLQASSTGQLDALLDSLDTPADETTVLMNRTEDLEGQITQLRAENDCLRDAMRRVASGTGSQEDVDAVRLALSPS